MLPYKSGTDITNVNQVRIGTIVDLNPLNPLNPGTVYGETEVLSMEGTTMKFGSGKGGMKFGVEDHSVMSNSNDCFSFSTAKK